MRNIGESPLSQTEGWEEEEEDFGSGGVCWKLHFH